MAPRINAIVAVCDNMGIGVNGALPWKLKSELSFFKRMTSNTVDPTKKNMVVMGRRTWESIPAKFRPLPGRVNVVLSTQPRTSDIPEEVPMCSSFDDIVKFLSQPPLSEQIETAWIIGGSSVYRRALTLDCFHRLYMTEIHKQYNCDTFLNPIDPDCFKIVEDAAVCQETQEEDGVTFNYIVYEKLKTLQK